MLNYLKPHLNKCFANINSLEISDKQLEITHLLSFEGERLDIPKTIRIRGPAEQWLGKSIYTKKQLNIILSYISLTLTVYYKLGSLESGMFDSIKRHLKV